MEEKFRSTGEDDDKSLETLFDDRANSEHGAARLLLRDIIDTQNRLKDIIENRLTYERQPLPDNPYHGGIVFHERMTRPVERLVASTLALKSVFVPRQS